MAKREAASSRSNYPFALNRNTPPGNPHADDPWFRFFFGQRGAPPGMEPQRGLGSGVIVSAEGYLLTKEQLTQKIEWCSKVPLARAKMPVPFE